MTREEAINRVRTLLSAGWGPENNEAIRFALSDMEAMAKMEAPRPCICAPSVNCYAKASR